jgi:hypothetical protein
MGTLTTGANATNSYTNFNRKERKDFYFFEKRKEHKALRPLRSTDKGIKNLAHFAANKKAKPPKKQLVFFMKCCAILLLGHASRFCRP